MLYDDSVGVECVENRTDGILLLLDTREYPTPSDQVGIINYIELAKTTDKQIFYGVDDTYYCTAEEFRINHGYGESNEFFKSQC